METLARETRIVDAVDEENVGTAVMSQEEDLSLDFKMSLVIFVREVCHQHPQCQATHCVQKLKQSQI